MSSLFWERAHGGLTHFPIALIFVATLFDILSFVRAGSSKSRDFQAVAYWLAVGAALAAIGAVFSGLALSKWKIIGTGLMRQHHLFVWPAFALILGLTTWRVATGNEFSRRAFAGYLVIACAACALIGAAGFVGGEMLLGETNSSSNGQMSPVMVAEAVQGRHLFLMNCAHCHGDDAHGDEGPDLHNLHKSDALIHHVITAGIKGEMPSFAKKFRDPEVRQLTAYLRTLRS
jgi:mono/diheme cytochrome c family protein